MGAARSKDGTTYPALKRSNSEGDEPHGGPFDNHPGSFHEQLVRQRGRGHNFDDIYEVCNEIGHGGLCKIFKVRKYDDKIGGSSRPEGVRTKTRLIRDSIRGKVRSNNDLMSALEQGNKKETTTSFTIKELSVRANGGGRTSSEDESDEPAMPKPAKIADRTKSAPASSASSPSGMYFALKVINLALVKEDQIDQLQNEVEILKTLDHKNIIKAYETFQMKKHKKLMIVMELCTGGDMYARMPYTERQVGSAMRQVLSAISYMHHKHIIHRDLKLENIIWESEHPEAMVKVIDFGLSKQYSPQNNILTERVGTLYSMSPETMKGDYTAQADLWSLGVCTFIMLSMSKPFEGKTPKQLVANVLQCNYKFESSPQKGGDENVWDKISDFAKSFISQLLVLEQEKRLTADQAKTNEWFSHCGLNKGIVNKQSSTSDHDNNADLWAQHPIGASLTEEEDDDVNLEELGLDELLGDDGGESDGEDSDQKRNSYISPFTSEEFKDRVRANMIEYAEMGEFRRLALNVIAKKSTSVQIFEIRKVFDEFDTNNTGTITLEEFKAALAQFEYSEEDIMAIFTKIDINNSNVINYTEFLAAALETQGSIEEYRLAEAFDMLDSDDSGYISRENLRQLLGKNADERYIDALIAEADFKKDGRISYQEFLQLFSQSKQREISTIYERTVSEDLDQEADKVLQKHGFVIKFRPYSKNNVNEDGISPSTPTGGGRGIRRFLPPTPSSGRKENGHSPPMRNPFSAKDQRQSSGSSGSAKGDRQVSVLSPPAAPDVGTLAPPLTAEAKASSTEATSENGDTSIDVETKVSTVSKHQ
mmetsp:Transcript_12390/g.27305  ORF Transcript_12390/g.27305 Transcript_12390/m.27305 type:complete len:820 (-) Transcript_12390:147-2606(-)